MAIKIPPISSPNTHIDTEKNDVSIVEDGQTINFEPGAFDVIADPLAPDEKTTVTIPDNIGDIDDDRLISVKCVPGTNCIQDVSLLVDDTVCFIKSEEC